MCIVIAVQILAAELSDYSNFRNRLLLLKFLDSVIDFSKASNQLELILYLYRVGRSLDTDELAKLLGASKKSILDSLRKLEKKGLVIKDKDEEKLRVTLSDRGVEFVKKFIELLKPLRELRGEPLTVPVRLNLAREMLTAVLLYKLIIYTGLVRQNSYVLIEELPKLLNAGKSDIDVLVSSFIQPPTKLFKVIKVGGRDALALDKHGLEVFRRTAHYRVYSTNRIYRLLVKLTKTPWIAEAVMKLNIVLSLVLALTLLLHITAVLHPWVAIPLGLFIAVAMLALNAFTHASSRSL